MIYTPENTWGIGKPVKCFLDGKEIKQAFWADTKKGKVKAYREPLQPDKYGRRALTVTMYGKVEIRPVEQQ